jgi:hypothetical protein
LRAGAAVLDTISALRPHLDWMLRIAPHAIAAGELVRPPFVP